MGQCCVKGATPVHETEPEVTKQSAPSSKTDDAFGLSKHFEAIRVLGEGGTGETWLMKDKESKELVAVKLIRRPIPKALHKMLVQEVLIQRDLGEGHLNIVTSKEVVLTPTHLAFVLEYISGGTLTKYVSDRWLTVNKRGGLFLTEDEARYYFKQFLSAVEYMHGHKVAHRDLKLDNTLLDENDPPYIKICDFGFAKNFEANANMYTQIGTPVYMSPEVISSKRGRTGYDGQKADIWASGVMLFVMLLGMFPYEHSEHPDPNTSGAQIEVWLQQIKNKWREGGRVREAAKRLSPECRDLLDHIFDLNEKRRMSIADIRSHPWFAGPMSAKHEEAWSQLQYAQNGVNHQIASGRLHRPQRDEAIKDMMSQAAVVGRPTEEAKRISMTDLPSSYTYIKNASQMTRITI